MYLYKKEIKTKSKEKHYFVNIWQLYIPLPNNKRIILTYTTD